MSGFGQTSYNFGGSSSGKGGGTSGGGFFGSSPSAPFAFGQQHPAQQSSAFGNSDGITNSNIGSSGGSGNNSTPVFGTATGGGFGNHDNGRFSGSFGFGQQQQGNNNVNVFGGPSSANAAPILTFGTSSTVVATAASSAAIVPPSSSFGNNYNITTHQGPTTSSFGPVGATTTTPFFGTSAFGSSSNTTSSNNHTALFASSSPPTSSTFGSSSTPAATTAAATGSFLSANAAPFTPAGSVNTGFGSSIIGGSSLGGGNTTSSNTFGGGGFGGTSTFTSPSSAAATTTITTTAAAAPFGGGFQSSQKTATPPTTIASGSTFSTFGNANNAAMTNESSSSYFPFGSRIPRKDKVINDTTTTADHNIFEKQHDNGDADSQLAALRAKIQEKKQRLLDKKKAQQQQQQQSSMSPFRGKTTTDNNDSDRNAELAARNALRFAPPLSSSSSHYQDNNKSLSSLLPADLQARRAAAARVTELNGSIVVEGGDDGGNNVNHVYDYGGDDDDDVIDEEVDDDDDDNDDDHDVTVHRNVDNAKSLIGICTSMCPDEELLRREREGDIQLLEITDPGGLHPSHWTLRDTAVKRFRRSAADFKLDIPELVRPPEVLERVCGYLEEWVMERDRQGPDKRWAQAATTTSDTPPPLDVYQFIWDRTRMIRKDFILQNFIGTGGNCDARAVRCHERIARWHAMCEHQLSHIPDFVKHQSQQNIAELGQTMKTLNLYYDDALGRALTEPASSSSSFSPGGSDYQGCASDIVMGKPPTDFDGSVLSNDAQSAEVSKRIIGKNGVNSPALGTAEPEMRGLYILLTMNNEGGMEVLKYSGRLCTEKPEIFYSKPVQLALTIFQAKKDHNYAKFFRLLRCPSTPYLFSCIMFKYVENMRKETLLMMSKVYGAKHKTTGEAFYDSYPLDNLVNLLCYEDETEAREACRHYGIKVEGDQVLWRHSKFREPTDPEKGIILSLKPRKMIRTIESKLNGATRLAVCRGGVSGEGATLSKAPTGVDADALLRDRQKTQEEMKKKLFEAKAREDAERLKQEELKKDRLRREQMEAEKRAKAEAARRAEQERIRQEQLDKERLERIEAEEKARKVAAEREERLRREKDAREKKEREIAEAKRKAEEEKKRKLDEEERLRRLEEEKRRREEEERRRIARELELKRMAEEERIRKAKEEEERRIEMAWRQKIENARKLLIFRLLRKQTRRQDSLKKSRNSLSNLDPTCTQYPSSVYDQVPRDLFRNITSTEVVTEVVTKTRGSCDELENHMYRLATAPRQQLDLSKVAEDYISKSYGSYQSKESYPAVVRTSGYVKLFKLAILLPTRTRQYEHLYDTLRMWVESHLELDEVSSSMFSLRSNQIDVRTVAVIGNEDATHCKYCDAALVLLPSFGDEIVPLEYSEQALELLEQNVPRMVLVLDTADTSCRNIPATTERLIYDMLGGGSQGGSALQREGVIAPNLCDFDIAFRKCCQVLVISYLETTQCENECNPYVDPSIVRVSLSDIGFLCLQRCIQNMDENGFFKSTSNTSVTLFDVCKNTLSSLSHELSSTQEEIHQQWKGWPSQEFFFAESVESFFGENCDLPSNWHEPRRNLGGELKRFFQHLLESSTFTLFVESVVGSLPQSIKPDLLFKLDNGDISSCFSIIVTLVVSGEINIVSDRQTILYLPSTTLSSIIERAAAYEVPDQVEQDLDIPDYLIFGLNSDTLEEKENNNVGASNEKIMPKEATPVENKDKTVSKRRLSDNMGPELLLQKERQKKMKRTKLNRKVDTEEERNSKSFTLYLQALLGDV